MQLLCLNENKYKKKHDKIWKKLKFPIEYLENRIF